MSDPGCGAGARNLIHCSFNGFGKTQSPRLPCNGNLQKRQPSCQDILGRICVLVVLSAADTAGPLTHIQLTSALGAGACMTHAALLRGVALSLLVVVQHQRQNPPNGARGSVQSG